MKKPIKRPLALRAERIRELSTTDLRAAAAGIVCSQNPSCQVCDTVAPDCVTTSTTTF